MERLLAKPTINARLPFKKPMNFPFTSRLSVFGHYYLAISCMYWMELLA
jgi:hypothetical protein